MLIDRSGPHNRQTTDYPCALKKACSFASVELVDRILAQKQIDVNIVDNTRKETALHVLVQGGQTEERVVILKRLFNSSDFNPNIVSALKESVISKAIAYDSTALFDVLLLHDTVDVNLGAQDSTPLMMTLKAHKYDMAKKLLDLKRCDINITNKNQESALILAVRQFETEVHHRDDHLKMIQSLLKKERLKVNMQDKLGNTAFHYCSDVKLVNMFLEHPDVDIKLENNQSLTCLRIAIQKSNKAVIETVVQSKKYNPNECDSDGLTDLMWCVLPALDNCQNFRCKDEGLLKTMIEVPHADAAKMRYDGSRYASFLHCIMMSVRLSVLMKVSHLCGDMFNVRDVHSKTFLHHLCLTKKPQLCDAEIAFACDLIGESDIDVNIQDKYGYTALMYAVRNPSQFIPDVIVAILNHPKNCDISLQNKYYQTVVDIVEAHKNEVDPKVVSLLKPYMGFQLHLKQISLMDGIQCMRRCIDKSTLSVVNRNDLHKQMDRFESDVKVMETGRDYQMKDEHREKLLSLRPYLLENISPDKLLDYLISKGTLDEDEEDDIHVQGSRRRQVQKLLSILPLKGPQAYEHFINALKVCNQAYIAERLEDNNPSALEVAHHHGVENPATELFSVNECLFLLSSSIEKKLVEITSKK